MEFHQLNIKDLQFQAFKSGNISGFNYFFNLFYKPLCYFAYSSLQDQSVAEEITDDVFLKLWNRHHLFASEQLIKSFLYKSVRNASLNHIQKCKTEATLQKNLSYLLNISEPCIQQHIIRTETINLIYQTMEILPDKCLKVFKLFYLENKSYEEIALELRITINAARNHRMRALTLLKSKLGTSLLLAAITVLTYNKL